MAPNTSNSVTETVENIKEEDTSVRTRNVNTTGKSLDEATANNRPAETVSRGIDDLQSKVFKPQIRWPDLLAQVFVHCGCLYGLYYLITLQAKFYTYIWCKLALHKSLVEH